MYPVAWNVESPRVIRHKFQQFHRTNHFFNLLHVLTHYAKILQTYKAPYPSTSSYTPSPYSHPTSEETDPYFTHHVGQERPSHHCLPCEYGFQPPTPADPQELKNIKAQQQVLPGKDVDMDPLAEFTKLECWDDDGKPYLKEVSVDWHRADFRN